MADEDDNLPPEDLEDEGLSAEGEDAEGSDPGEGDDEGDVSTERTDAPSEEDLGSQGLGEAESPLGTPATRGHSRQARLSRENAELRARLARMEGATDATAQLQNAERQRQEAWERDQRRAAMTDEERWWDDHNTRLANLEQQRNWDRVWLASQMDKSSYEAKVVSNPVYARHAAKVEQLFAEQQRQGRTWPREMILRYLIGETALANAGKATSKARKEGRQRIEANTTRPGSAKGDATSTRSRGGSSLEGRLKGMDI